MSLSLVIIVSFRKFYFHILLKQKFLAKPRYATFQKKMRRRVAASLRRRRTVRYFFIFVVLHASFSFGVWPIESRSGCDGVTLFMRPFLVTLRGSCEVPKKTDFSPQDLSFFFFLFGLTEF